MTSLGRFTRAVAAALALAALLVGAPLALARFGTLPDHIPDLGSIGDALTSRDDGTLFLIVLSLAGWIVWASFVLAVVVEIPAQLRGHATRRLPALGPQQRLAGALIAAILFTATAPAVASAASMPSAPPMVSAAYTTATDAPQAADHLTHTAAAGETLASVTRLYLGDPTLYQKVVNASVGLVQPDGTTITSQTTTIKAGWTLRIPLDAIAPAAVDHAQENEHTVTVAADGTIRQALAAAGEDLDWRAVYARNRALPQSDGGQLLNPNQVKTGWTLIIPTTEQTTGQLVYTVDRHDWLFHIAERYLGDGDRYPEIAALNPQYADRHNASGSRHFPDHIETGWKLKLPTEARDRGAIRHANGTAAAPTAANRIDEPIVTEPPASPAAPAAPPTAPTVAPTPASTAPTEAPTQTPAQQQTPAVGQTDDQAEHAAEAAFNTPLAATAALASAGVLASLILVLLRRRRNRAQQHRPVGRRLASPDPVPEVATRHAAKPDVERLDKVLRHLGHAAEGRPAAEMPDVAAAWLDGGEVALIFAQDCPNPPQPFIAASTNTWIAPSTAEIPAHPEQPCPVPGLLTISTKPGGGDLLVDTERTSLLTIVGDPARSADLLRYLAAEAATCTWADEASITLAGFDPETTHQLITLNEHRVKASNDIAGALSRITRRSTASHAALHAGASPDTLTARINDLHGDVWPLQVLILADPTGQYTAELAALDDHLNQYPRTGVVVIATSPTVTRWSIDIDTAGGLAVEWLGTQSGSPATQLSASELADLATIVRNTRPSPATVSQAPFDEVPPADSDGPAWAAGVDSHGSLLEALFGTATADDQAHSDDEPVDEHPADNEPEHVEEPEPADEPEEEQATADPAPEQPSQAAAPIVAVPAPWKSLARQRAAADPDLDADFAEWHAAEVIRPRIAILGPVHLEATGQVPEERLPFYTELAVFLAQRGARGATTDEVIANLWADRGLGANVVRVYVAKVRKWLGEDNAGEPWLPPNPAGGAYIIRPGYLSDWDLFRRRRARGESRGPAGTTDLRAALELVRGAPLDGADRALGRPRNPYAWLPDSSISPYHLTAAIVDTAHALVELYLAAGDTEGARWAVNRAWTADPDRTDDHPWRDLMRIAHAEGHDSEVRAIYEDLMTTRNVEVPEELATPTCNLVYELLGERLAHA